MKRRKGLLDEEKFLPPLPEQLPRGVSSLPGYGQTSPVAQGLLGFTGRNPTYSVMDPDAQQMSDAYRLGEQASVASQLYGSVLPFAAASTLAKAGQIPGAGAQIFIGPRAKTWNESAAALANKLESEGVNPREIWRQTGTWRGPEGKWRQEISDKESFYRGVKAAESSQSENVFLHPELYKAYPITARSKVIEHPSGGSFNPVNRQITVGNKNAASTMVHEQQHAIQEIEDFAKGGSPREVADKMNELKKLDDKMLIAFDKYVTTEDDVIRSNAAQELAYLGEKREKLRQYKEVLYPEEGYVRLAGEAEARAAQARIGMTPEQRRNVFPEDSYDLPVDNRNLIFQSLGAGLLSPAVLEYLRRRDEEGM